MPFDLFEKQLNFIVEKIDTGVICDRAESVFDFEMSVINLSDNLTERSPRELIQKEMALFERASSTYKLLDSVAQSDVQSHILQKFERYKYAYESSIAWHATVDEASRDLVNTVRRLKLFVESDDIFSTPKSSVLLEQKREIDACEKYITLLNNSDRPADRIIRDSVNELRKNVNKFTEPYQSDFNGTGVVHLDNGIVYSRTFKNGIAYGEGTAWYRGSGSGNEILRYSGEFYGYDITGKGTIEYADGNKYTGDVVDGERHGYGELTDRYGNFLYRGHWTNDGKHPVGKEQAYYRGMDLLGNDYIEALVAFKTASPIFDSDEMIEVCNKKIAEIEEKNAAEFKNKKRKERNGIAADVFANIAYIVLFCGSEAVGLWLFGRYGLKWYSVLYSGMISIIHIVFSRHIKASSGLAEWDNDDVIYIIFRALSQVMLCGVIVGSLFMFFDIDWQAITAIVLSVVAVELIENLVPCEFADEFRENLCSARIIPVLLMAVLCGGLTAAAYYGSAYAVLFNVWHLLWVVGAACIVFAVAFYVLYYYSFLTGEKFVAILSEVMLGLANVLAAVAAMEKYGTHPSIEGFFIGLLLFVVCGGIGVANWFVYRQYVLY